MNEPARLVTHYNSSKGPKLISALAPPYLANAIAKLERDGYPADRTAEVAAMKSRLVELEAMASDEDRIAATTPAATIPTIGHNNPPSAPTTYAEAKARIDDLYGEAKNWADGQPIATQAQADAVSRLKGMIAEAEKQAEALRKIEAKAFDDGKAEVQTRYMPLIGDKGRGLTDKATTALQRLLTPWLLKLDAEVQARRVEAERVAQAAIEAAQVIAAAADMARLDDAEVVEEAVQEAKTAIRKVKAADNDRARVGGGEYRSTLLKNNWVATLEDGDIALSHYWKMQRGACEAFLADLAAKDLRVGKRTIPGFVVDNQKRAA
jgi:hypothetical protein